MLLGEIFYFWNQEILFQREQAFWLRFHFLMNEIFFIILCMLRPHFCVLSIFVVIFVDFEWDEHVNLTGLRIFLPQIDSADWNWPLPAIEHICIHQGLKSYLKSGEETDFGNVSDKCMYSIQTTWRVCSGFGYVGDKADL